MKKMVPLDEIMQLKTEDPVVEVWKAIMGMKIRELEPLLNEDVDYEDIGKDAFVKKILNRFNIHYDLGDSELLLTFDTCNSCNCNKAVSRFIGKQSKKEFALYFEIKADKIVDIYYCNWYGDQFMFPF
jgi:hypothetical protein